MYQIATTNRFEKDLKRAKKRGKDTAKLRKIIRLLATNTPLPIKNRDHILSGNYANHRECHIEPDWLLIYKIDLAHEKITLERTGTHSDLF